jgi:tetratricopeptide (TPR) repeat protein
MKKSGIVIPALRLNTLVRSLAVMGMICCFIAQVEAEVLSPAQPMTIDPSVAAIWKDPSFQKQFIGSYGINADIEPRVTPEELEILEHIRPLMAEDMSKAEAALKKQVNKDSSAMLDFTLASIYFQQDKKVEALENYLKAVTKFPGFRRAWRNLGLLHVREGNNDQAIKAFTRMIELGGGDAYSYGLLGLAYASKQDYQAAEAAYRNALLLQPDNTEWRLGITRCAFKQEKFEDAVTLLEVLIDRYPHKTEFWLLQAQAYLGMKQPLKATENLEAVYALGKANVESLNTLGDIYLSENLMELAAGAYQRAIDTDLQQALARPLKSVEMLASRGGNAQARSVVKHIHEVLEKGMTEDDRRKLLKLDARLSLAEGKGDAEGIKVLEELVKLDPLDGEALLLIGQQYALNNEPDRAIFYYERAGNLEAFELKAKLRHAQILVSKSKYAEALPLLRRVQALKPQDDVQKYLEQIERLAKGR